MGGFKRPDPGNPCSVPGCDRPQKTKGLCNGHAERLRLGGDVKAAVPLKPRRSSSDALDEVLARASRSAAPAPYQLSERCLLLGDGEGKRPYVVDRDGSSIPVARVAYREWVGPLSPGSYVLHRCDNPSCIEPSHLYLGTQAQNMADKIARGRDRSSRGEGHFRARLNADAVREIRRRRQQGDTMAAIAHGLGVAHGTVKAVVDGRTWAHVT